MRADTEHLSSVFFAEEPHWELVSGGSGSFAEGVSAWPHSASDSPLLLQGPLSTKFIVAALPRRWSYLVVGGMGTGGIPESRRSGELPYAPLTPTHVYLRIQAGAANILARTDFSRFQSCMRSPASRGSVTGDAHFARRDVHIADPRSGTPGPVFCPSVALTTQWLRAPEPLLFGCGIPPRSEVRRRVTTLSRQSCATNSRNRANRMPVARVPLSPGVWRRVCGVNCCY